jgi:iron complex transport system permease protein
MNLRGGSATSTPVIPGAPGAAVRRPTMFSRIYKSLGENRRVLSLGILGGVLLLSVSAALSFGAAREYSISSLFSGTEFERDILVNIRLPRVLFALFCGAGLAITGVLAQCLFRNPLAEPYLMGTSAGAMLFAIIAIFASSRLGTNFHLGAFKGIGPAVFSFLGAALACGIVLRLGKTSGGQVHFVLLAGIAINALASSFSGVFIFLANDRELRDITFWNLGSYGAATYPAVLMAGGVALVAGITAYVMRRRLDALLLGEQVAFDLGVKIRRDRRIIFFLIVLCQGVLVSLTGMIMFVSLVAPHLTRMLVGASHRYLVLGSILLGSIISLLADTVARRAAAPAEIPLGVLTGLLGAPFFLYMLTRHKARTMP